MWGTVMLQGVLQKLSDVVPGEQICFIVIHSCYVCGCYINVKYCCENP